MKIQVAEGDQIAFILDGEQVVITPITHTLLKMRGRVRVRGRQDFDSIRGHWSALPQPPDFELEAKPII